MSDPQPTCDSCDAPLPVGDDGNMPSRCPACGQWVIVDDQPAEPAPAIAPEDELEAVKIRQVVRERRALIRTRGYSIVLLLACGVIAAQLAYRGIREGSILRLLAAAILLVVLARIFRVVIEQGERLSKSLLPPPATQPDFSGLSDGSQHARHLDQTQE